MNNRSIFFKFLDQICISKKKRLEVGRIQKPISGAKINKMVYVQESVVVLASEKSEQKKN